MSQGFGELKIAIVELIKGECAVGFMGASGVFYAIFEHLSPQDAANKIRDIMFGRISPDDLVGMEWTPYDLGQHRGD